MNKLNDLFLRLKQHDVKVQELDGKLKISLPEGFDSHDLLNEVRQSKEAVLSFLQNRKKDAEHPVIASAPENENGYPLSTQQTGLYLSYALDQASTAYNVSFAMRLRGNVDRDKMREAFRSTIQRHANLRTIFKEIDGVPRQFVIGSFEFDIEHRLATGKPVEEEIGEFIRPFDLEAAPLVRVGLLEISEREFIMVIDLHHIICDGPSFNIIQRDFITFYQGKTPLHSPGLQYKDFATFQNDFIQSTEFENKRNFWKQKFSGEIPRLNFPLDNARPLHMNFNGDTVNVQLPAYETSCLKTVSRSQGVTLNTTLLSAFTVLLNKLSNQNDLVYGIITDGRPYAELTGVVGMFTTTLPMRTSIGSSQSFASLLQATKIEVVEALHHQQYGYQNLLSDLQIKREPNRNALFDVSFAYNGALTEYPQEEGLTIERYNRKNSTAIFDISVEIAEELDRSLTILLRYNTDLFNRRSIERYAECFLNIINQVSTNPTITIGSIDIIPTEDKKRILKEFNNTEVDFDPTETFDECFDQSVALYRDRVAVSYGEQSISYKELHTKVEEFSEVLRSNNVVEGSRVCVLLPRSIDTLVVLMALLKIRATYIPIEVDYPEERVRRITRDSQSHFLITERGIEKLDEGAQILTDPPAYIIYTSGTTGEPKGVMVHHKGMMNHLYAKINDLDITSSDVLAQTASVSFDISIWQFLAGLLVGAQVRIIDKKTIYDPSDFISVLQRHGITIVQLVPSLLNVFLESTSNIDDKELPRLRWMIPTGETLSVNLARKWFARYRGIKLLNAYGPTEASDDITHHIMSSCTDELRSIPIGKPVQNTHIYILNSDLQLCPIGVEGEVCVAGAGVGMGYWNNISKTEKSFVPNPLLNDIDQHEYQMIYKTGDFGFYNDNGIVEFIGRKDNQVKINGNRIELQEITECLLGNEDIDDAVVVTQLESKKNTLFLVAYYSASKQVNVDDLRQFLRTKLPEYMVPVFFVQLQSLPLTFNGKIDKQALPGVDPASAQTEKKAPTNALEGEMIKIWGNILGTTQLGITDNFFEYGGDSIKAIQISARLRSAGYNIPMRDIYSYPTIEQLAKQFSGDTITSVEQQVTGKFTYDELSSEELEKLEKEFRFEDVYALTPMQNGMLYHHLMSNGADAYHRQASYRLMGKMNVALVREALQSLGQRHDVLRTIILSEGFNQPLQVVLRSREIAFNHVDLRATASKEETVNEYREKDKQRNFDFRNDSLIRVELLQLSDDEFEFIWSFHHIIMDGWCISILINEFMHLYMAAVQGQQSTLPTANQYRDFIRWISNRDKDHTETYWRKYLEGFEQLTSVVPFDTRLKQQVNPDDLKDFNGILTREDTNNVKALASRLKVTQNAVLQAVWSIVLYRYTGRKDVVFGDVVSGRPAELPGVEKMLGLFINTVPKRADLECYSTFDVLAARMQSDYVEGEPHHHYSLAEIQKIGGEKLFDHIYVYQNFPGVDKLAALNGGDSDVNAWNGFQITKVENLDRAEHDLSLTVMPGDQLVISYGFNTKVLDVDFIKNLHEQFCKILFQAIESPGKAIDDFEILTDADRTRLLVEFNDSACETAGDETLVSLFEKAANKYPERIALTYNDVELSYRELNEASNRVAKVLLSTPGVEKGSKIGLMVPRDEWMVICTLAIFKSGTVFVPIDPTYPTERIKHILHDSDAMIISLDDIKSRLNEFDGSDIPSASSLSGLAYIIYTSGSTGKPKGVMVEHKNLVGIIQGWIEEYQLDKFTVCSLQTASMAFDVYIADICRTLLTGGKMVICPFETRLVPEELYQLMFDRKINFIDTTPALLQPLVKYVIDNRLDLSFMKVMVIGSDVLHTGLYNQVLENFGKQFRIVNAYGTTETTVDTCFFEGPLDEQSSDLGVVPIGKPFGNNKIYILDQQGRLAPVGAIGELCIGGPGVTGGYLNNELLTQEKFVMNQYLNEKLYKTGDLARWLPSGNLFFIGRNDNQVKIRGFRVELGEIENQIMKYEGVDEACVLLHKNSANQEVLVAYYTCQSTIDETDLRDYLSNHIPYYMIPTVFFAVDFIPLSPAGKVQKKLLPVPDIKITEDYCAPVNECEAKLTAIWSDILNIPADQISTSGNFFELGGHSLNATVLLARISKEFNVKIQLNEIFSNSTIQEIAEIIGNKQWLKISKVSEDAETEKIELSI